MTDFVTFPEVMVTAHRRLPKDIDWLPTALRVIVRRLTDEFDTERFTTGLATGGDQLFGTAVQDLRLELRAAIPYPDQPLDGADAEHFGPRWTKAQRECWQTLKAYAEATGGAELVSERNPRTGQERIQMLHARNDWMLANTQAVVAIWAPANTRGGTYSCLRKAAGAGKPIILVNLAARTITRPLPKHWAEYLNMPSLTHH